jgi:hypothetical protein
MTKYSLKFANFSVEKIYTAEDMISVDTTGIILIGVKRIAKPLQVVYVLQ